MPHNWLLVETLGTEPLVVAYGTQLKNLVPLGQFLRRTPRVAAMRTAIAESVQTGQPLASITPRGGRVIRTEPIVMSDGRVHGVHVWSGSVKDQPPARPVPGPMKWDLTSGVATETTESLANAGKDPAVEATHGRAFAEELPAREFNPDENRVLALTIRAEPGQLMCNTWDITDFRGTPIRVGFVARTARESTDGGGGEHLVARGMNWRGELDVVALRRDRLSERILDGLARPGVHRALVDLNGWRLLKWLDDPCPFYEWRGAPAAPRVHPEDLPTLARLSAQLADGPAAAVLRAPGAGGSWVPLHVSVNRIELEPGVFAGLVALRLPTPDELAAAEAARGS